MPLLESASLAAVGLLAGTAGAMVGFGGAIVIIPVLTLFAGCNQHLSQAVAMIVNIFVAIPALMQHQRAGAIRWGVVVRVLPFALLFVLVGVELSDRFDAELLHKAFGLFLLYVVAAGVMRLSRQRPDHVPPPARLGIAPTGFVGGITGLLAGLLGIGGGPVAVPMLRRVCRLRVRESVAASTALVLLISVVGAARKNASLSRLVDAAGDPLGLRLEDSLTLAAHLAPTALIGGLLGAVLTHRVPVKAMRIALLILLSWAGLQMLA